MFVFSVGILFSKYTRSGRNSELIINTNNILLKVINDNFGMLQFTAVLAFLLYCFTFCIEYLLGGHHPPECTGAHELESCA
jgi:hypothetical protein